MVMRPSLRSSAPGAYAWAQCRLALLPRLQFDGEPLCAIFCAFFFGAFSVSFGAGSGGYSGGGSGAQSDDRMKHSTRSQPAKAFAHLEMKHHETWRSLHSNHSSAFVTTFRSIAEMSAVMLVGFLEILGREPAIRGRLCISMELDGLWHQV